MLPCTDARVESEQGDEWWLVCMKGRYKISVGATASMEVGVGALLGGSASDLLGLPVCV